MMTSQSERGCVINLDAVRRYLVAVGRENPSDKTSVVVFPVRVPESDNAWLADEGGEPQTGETKSQMETAKPKAA